MPGADAQMRSYHKRESSEARCQWNPPGELPGRGQRGMGWGPGPVDYPVSGPAPVTMLVTVVKITIPSLPLQGL